MVFVVERYLPGLLHTGLLSGLTRLAPAIQEIRDEGSAVRYLGSTIVLGDEACFCEFEGSSQAAVAEVNRRAGLPFDRIVPAVLVQSTQRSSEMSISTSTSMPKSARAGRARAVVLMVAIVAIVAIAAVAAWPTTSHPANKPVSESVPTESSVLQSLTPEQRKRVIGIARLNAAELAAAFGRGR